MMQNKSMFAILPLLIGAAACQVVETPEPVNDRLTISITADPVYEDGMGPETKAVIRGTKMYWSPGDTLGVFPDRGSQVYFLVDSEGEAISAPFDGGAWEFKANSIYTSYYPLVGEFYLTPDRIPVQYYKEKNGEIKLQTQIGNDSSIHTSNYLYMYTDPQEVIDGNISFAYHHLWTVLKPIVTLPAGHYTKLTFSLDDPLFVVKGYFDLTSDAPSIIGTEFASEVSMNLDVTFDAPTTLTAYYATAPLDMQGKTLSITITEESGRQYTYTYSPSKAYKAGTTYRLASTESFANNVIYYTSTDGKVVTPSATNVFGATIQSNEYVDGQGVITFDGDVTSIGTGAFSSRKTLLSVSIPGSVTSIGQVAFMDCSSLQVINIPESVTEIGSSAFIRCSSLSSTINIPNSVTSLGDSAFSGCVSLSSFSGKYSADNGRCLIRDNTIIAIAPYGLTSYSIPSGVTAIEYAFSSCDLFSITIPNTVETIGHNAFFACKNLSTINIPESVTIIGYQAFTGSGLTSIIIPSNVKTIYSHAFEKCRNLESVTIEDGVSSIGDTAFMDCVSLTSIILPESVSQINSQAFSNCTNLSSIIVNVVNPPTFAYGNTNAFSNTICPIYVPSESVEAYKTATGWKTYSDRIKRIFQIIPISTPIPEAIDLGLSVKWASFNLGASTPYEYGGYYAWGETEQKDVFGNPTYRWSMASYDKLIKYCTKSSYGFNSFTDGKSVLDSEDDAAHVHLNGNWRLPTKDELTELKTDCTWEPSTMNGINGWIVTGPNGNIIFLPAAGGWSDSGVCDDPGIVGHYWSSSIEAGMPSYAYSLELSSNGILIGWGGSPRMFGYSIRPVTD